MKNILILILLISGHIISAQNIMILQNTTGQANENINLSIEIEKKLSIAAQRCKISREQLLKRALLQFLRSLHKSQFTHGNTKQCYRQTRLSANQY